MKIKASVLKNFLNNYELAPGGIFGKKISKIRYNDKDELKLQFIKNYENGKVMQNFRNLFYMMRTHIVHNYNITLVLC